MRSPVRATARHLSRGIPLRALALLVRAPLIIYYHVVSDSALAYIRPFYEHKSARELEGDLDYLLKTYRPVELDDLLKTFERPLPPRSLFVTFDDGLRQAAEIAAPILKRKGVPAAFFLSSAFLDNRELFFRFKAALLIERLSDSTRPVDRLAAHKLLSTGGTADEDLRSSLLKVTYQQRAILDAVAQAWEVSFGEFLREERPYMTAEQAKGLLADGFHLGGHSVDHPRFSDIPLNDQLFQTEECMRALTVRIPLQSRIFSFPFTARGVSDEYFKVAAERGLAEAFFGTGGFGTAAGKRLFERVSFDATRPHSLKQKYLQYVRSRREAL